MIDANALFVPFEKAMDAFVYFYRMVPAKPVEFADIGEFQHSAVWFRIVPQKFSSETYLADNLFRTFLDAELLARTNIDVAVANLLYAIVIDAELGILHHIVPVDIEQAMYAGISHLLTPEELTHRCAGSP